MTPRQNGVGGTGGSGSGESDGRRVVVVSTVHHPDDPRIREKLIRTLANQAHVSYATRDPGPTDPADLTWIRLHGGRLRRNLDAWRVVLGGEWSVVSLHDPELLPLGIVAAWRGRRVVFDVHEDIPHQIRMRTWIPAPLRWVLAPLSLALLRLMERLGEVTLAEPGYAYSFRHPHPLIPNYLSAEALPEVTPERDGSVVYVGDVTVERGILELVEAAGIARRPLTVVGGMSEELRARVVERAEQAGVELRLQGRLPHREAMQVVSRCSVGMSPLRDLPNYRNSLPTKVLEYLALGVPVVATDLPGTRAVLRGWDAVWLVPPATPGEWAVAISEAAQAVDDAIRQAPTVRARYAWPDDLVRSVYLGTG